MPGILGQWFSIEMAIRVVVWLVILGVVVGLVIGLAMLFGRTLRGRRRELEHLTRVVEGRTVPTHDALRRWCQDRFITAANTAGFKRGTPEGLFAGDDCRYWHTLIEILDGHLDVDPRGRLEPAGERIERGRYEMQRLTMLGAPGDYHVWIHIEAGDPSRQTESLVAGGGKSRDEAIDDAVRRLALATAAVEQLRHKTTAEF